MMTGIVIDRSAKNAEVVRVRLGATMDATSVIAGPFTLDFERGEVAVNSLSGVYATGVGHVYVAEPMTREEARAYSADFGLWLSAKK